MEDEDDLEEHYFLQPTKGYNIVEKIKMANEELYEIEIPMSKCKRPKVSFRENLVDYEPEYSSDDGYGESGTSTSDHEAKNGEGCSRAHEECDLERELEKLRCCSVKDKASDSEAEEEIVEGESENEGEEGQDESECGCESDQYENEDYEEDDDDHCGQQGSSCSECQMVEKLVAELVVKKATDDDKPPPPPPPPKKKKMFKSKFGRRGRGQDDTNFEVIETEHGRFRGCCRHKAENVEGMPSYRGAISLYGLSEEQYRVRQDRIERMERAEKENFEKLRDSCKEKSEANEDAFATWLKNKSRHPSNKTRNMYDTRKKSLTRSKMPIQKPLKAPSAKKSRVSAEERKSKA